MWKILYQLASPKQFYYFTGRWLPWCSLVAWILIFIGLGWGLIFAPPDYQQGDAFRMIYVHVPCAFLSMSIYGFMGFLSTLFLIWRIKIAGMMLEPCGQVGACMTFLALITGSLWGKPMWGAWWVWDARLTSELILLFLYGAILAVAQSSKNKGHSDKIMSILILIGLLDLPIIHYSVYWWNTLHQGATFLTFSKPKIDASMGYPLGLILLGFLLYCVSLILAKTRYALLLRERRQSWVKMVCEREA